MKKSNPGEARKLNVGTILVDVTNYNGRYPSFFRVTRTTGKSVALERLEKIPTSSDGYGQEGTVMPNLKSKGSPVKGLSRIKLDRHGNETISISKYSYTYVWDGKPEDFYGD